MEEEENEGRENSSDEEKPPADAEEALFGYKEAFV